MNNSRFMLAASSSGCGKTTLLRLLAGFLEPTGGKIFINDELQNGILPDKRKIGMVFQNYALFPHMTVEQNLLYGLKIKKSTKEEKARFNEIVNNTAQVLGIKELLYRFPHELSGGQQQRLCIARTIAVSPEVILMDEPCSALDPIATAKVEELISELSNQYTIAIVTHSMQQAARVSDRTAYFHLGDLIEVNSTEKVFTQPDHQLTEAYITGRFG